jgi:hypothetical protein
MIPNAKSCINLILFKVNIKLEIDYINIAVNMFNLCILLIFYKYQLIIPYKPKIFELFLHKYS